MSKEKYKKRSLKVERKNLKNFQNEEFLLFVLNRDDLKIVAANQKAARSLGKKIKDVQKNSCFLKEFIHPEKYPEFISELKSTSEGFAAKETEIIIPVKNENGGWTDYLFTNRVLSTDPEKDNNILIIGSELNSSHSAENPVNFDDILQRQALKRVSKYRDIMESMDDGFCIIEMIYDLDEKPVDYLFLETNPSFYTHTKITEAEGKTIREIAPFHEKYWFELYGSVVLEQKPVSFQQFAEKLGNIWFKVNAIPLGEKENTKVGIRFSDITQLKTAEEKLQKANAVLEEKILQRTNDLKKSSQLLQSVFDTTVEGIVVFEPIYDESGDLKDFEYIRVNNVITKQYRTEDLVGKRYFEINPDGEEVGVFGALKDTMLTGKPKDFEVFYNKNGYHNWFRITARRKNGLLISSLEDITKRKMESQQLKDSLRFKRQLTKTSPDIILIFNLYDEKIRYINRNMAKKVGMRRHDIMGMDLMSILPFIHPLEREKAMDFHMQILKAKDSDILDIEFRLKSVTQKWEWFNARAKVFMRNKNGKVFEYILMLRNIEEQKKIQKELIHAEKFSIKGEIARTFAHELRNPLASIGMAADILSKIDTDARKGKEVLENYIGIIRRSTKTMNKLVTDLLTSSNYSPSVLKKACLADILEKTLKLASDRIYLSGIEIKKLYDGPYFVNADEEKLKIAFLNLIINASEAMDPQKGILILKIEEKDSFFEMSIEDNGQGLKKNQLEKLFDSFYTQKENGLGIGLSSVKNIMEEHDAKIEVESTPAVGTIFKLYFQTFQVLEKA